MILIFLSQRSCRLAIVIYIMVLKSIFEEEGINEGLSKHVWWGEQTYTRMVRSPLAMRLRSSSLISRLNNFPTLDLGSISLNSM